jgi:hypothetical protein
MLASNFNDNYEKFILVVDEYQPVSINEIKRKMARYCAVFNNLMAT